MRRTRASPVSNAGYGQRPGLVFSYLWRPHSDVLADGGHRQHGRYRYHFLDGLSVDARHFRQLWRATPRIRGQTTVGAISDPTGHGGCHTCLVLVTDTRRRLWALHLLTRARRRYLCRISPLLLPPPRCLLIVLQWLVVARNGHNFPEFRVAHYYRRLTTVLTFDTHQFAFLPRSPLVQPAVHYPRRSVPGTSPARHPMRCGGSLNRLVDTVTAGLQPFPSLPEHLFHRTWRACLRTCVTVPLHI